FARSVFPAHTPRASIGICRLKNKSKQDVHFCLIPTAQCQIDGGPGSLCRHYPYSRTSASCNAHAFHYRVDKRQGPPTCRNEGSPEDSNLERYQRSRAA